MKKITLISSAIIIANTVFSQTLQEAITKTDNERFDAAAGDYRNLIAKETTKGDNYFYFGENYFKKGDLDSANICYKKGIELNATYPLNYVGLGKILWYNGQQAEAKTQLFKAATLGANKNAEVMRKTAEIYINAEQKSLDEAINLLNSAIKIEPKNAETYLLMGDAMLEKNPTDGGPAIKNYNKATELNPASPKGDLRSGRLYQRGQNYQLALDLYKKAQAIDSNYAPAYREKAELYHKAGQKANAIESYKKYLILNNSLAERERYASFLFNNKQYTEAIGELESLQKAGNTKFYLDRMLGYSYAELGNATDKEAYNKGFSFITKFFDKTSTVPNFKYVATDYKYKGILLAKTGKDSLGIVEMEKAAAMDPKLVGEITNEIAKSYMKSKRYDKAIATYENKMAGDPKILSAQDYFEMGRAYFFGPKDFVKSDSCFSKVTQSIPTFATAYFWRGKANVQQDLKNEKWLAKPHYEKALTLVKQEERAGVKINVIEASEYLGYYYLVMKDNAKAKEYFTIVKDLDPNNKKQIEFFKSPAGK
jgi:tetratricopeptide (TPR) repeat protein